VGTSLRDGVQDGMCASLRDVYMALASLRDGRGRCGVLRGTGWVGTASLRDGGRLVGMVGMSLRDSRGGRAQDIGQGRE